MDVSHRLERAADHFVGEAVWPIHLNDARAETLTDSEMVSFEADQISELEVSFELAGRNELLAGKSCALTCAERLRAASKHTAAGAAIFVITET